MHLLQIEVSKLDKEMVEELTYGVPPLLALASHDDATCRCIANSLSVSPDMLQILVKEGSMIPLITLGLDPTSQIESRRHWQV